MDACMKRSARRQVSEPMLSVVSVGLRVGSFVILILRLTASDSDGPGMYLGVPSTHAELGLPR
jgi:hypothetical protein